MKRAVITTSSSGLDDYDLVTSIEQIRLHIYVQNVEFVDGENINRDRLKYLMTEVSNSPVRTSPASYDEVAKLFDKLIEQEVKEVLAITLSSKMSESHAIISEVAKQYFGKLNVYVFDCRDLNGLETMLALEAELMMKQGASLASTVDRLEKLRNSHKMLFAVNDLSYLIRNKKLSSFSGFMANLLDIKPVLTVTDDGEIVPLNKIRKIEKAFDYIIEEFRPLLINKNTFLYILEAGDPQLTKYFSEMAKQRLNLDFIPILSTSSISMANHGPGAVGFCIFDGDVPQAAKLFEKS